MSVLCVCVSPRKIYLLFFLQVFNIGWDGVCAEYFLGYLYSCPGYPGKDKIYEAPSICLEQYLAIIMALKMGQKPINPNVIAMGSYMEYCYEHCYQKYTDQTQTYNEQCGQYISENFTQMSETLVAFRGIACAETNYTDQDNVNCYDELTAMQESATPGAPSPLSDYTCTIFAGNFPAVCMGFQSEGCCWGNQAVMLGQSLMKPIPPCLNKECADIAPILDICGRHINYATGSIEAWVYLDFAPPTLPNMYNNMSVLQFQAIAARPLQLLPTKVAVFDFTYYNGVTEITSNNPTAMSTATSGNFSILITVVSSTPDEINAIEATVNSPVYTQTIAAAFGNIGTVEAGTGAKRFYESDQIVTDGAGFHICPCSLSAVGAILLSIYLTRY